MTTICSHIDIMGMPSWSSQIECSSPHLRLDAADMSTSEEARRKESSGEIGDQDENAGTISSSTQGDHRTTPQDSPPPSRTVRKKKSSYDLRDEFHHSKSFPAPAPDLIISASSAATQDTEDSIKSPEPLKTQGPRIAEGGHGKRYRSRSV
jgi:hypothetical protein